MNVHGAAPRSAITRLSRATEWVEFASQKDLARAVGHLLGCHRHSFAVIPGEHWSLLMSAKAFDCISDAFWSYDVVDTSR